MEIKQLLIDLVDFFDEITKELEECPSCKSRNEYGGISHSYFCDLLNLKNRCIEQHNKI